MGPRPGHQDKAHASDADQTQGIQCEEENEGNYLLFCFRPHTL